MGAIAKRSDPDLWDRVKAKVIREAKGGKAGQWSARKAQLAVHDYKAQGGQYQSKKTTDNHLTQWTDEKWNTKSGRDSLQTGERYLPEAARNALSDKEYAQTSARKRDDLRHGRQFSAQPAEIAHKTGAVRHHDELQRLPRTELLKRAQGRKIAGRSRMTKAELVAALG